MWCGIPVHPRAALAVRRRLQSRGAGGSFNLLQVMSWVVISQVLEWQIEVNAFGGLVFSLRVKKGGERRNPTGKFSGRRAAKTCKRVCVFLKACLVF